MHLVLALLSEPPSSHAQPPAARIPVRALSRSEELARRVLAATWRPFNGPSGASLPTLRGRPRREAGASGCNPPLPPVKVSLRRSRFSQSSGNRRTDDGASAAERRTVRPVMLSVSRQFPRLRNSLGQERPR